MSKRLQVNENKNFSGERAESPLPALVNGNCRTLLLGLDECPPGKGLVLFPSRTKGYRWCMSHGLIERLGVPGILEVTRLTPKGRKLVKGIS